MSIKIDNISHKYGIGTLSEISGLIDVSFDFPDRFFYAVAGATGSGKSTFVQHINGLLKPDSGQIDVDGFILSSKKKECSKKIKNLRQKIGFLFQNSENQLFESTIIEDVMFGPLNFGHPKEEARKMAEEALKTIGINEDMFDKSPFETSGGEKRRIALAGVLAYKPSILILDEPTAGLDYKGKYDLLNLLSKLYEGGTNIIIVTHDMDTILNVCNGVLLFSNGKLVNHYDINEFFSSDLTMYSIEDSELINAIKSLKQRGFAVNFDNIKNVEDLLMFIRSQK
ncbi:MAG: ATP-binding cassette domain-containing protein [Bacilli bacterium]